MKSIISTPWFEVTTSTVTVEGHSVLTDHPGLFDHLQESIRQHCDLVGKDMAKLLKEVKRG